MIFLLSATSRNNLYVVQLNVRQIHIFFNYTKTQNCFMLTRSYLNLPVFNIKLFCFDVHNNFMFITGKNM